MFEAVSDLIKLKDTSTELFNLRDNSSSAEFVELVRQFEVEVDRLNNTLQDQFGSDPEVMQLVYEIKSAVVALRSGNVESEPSIG